MRTIRCTLGDVATRCSLSLLIGTWPSLANQSFPGTGFPWALRIARLFASIGQRYWLQPTMMGMTS